MRRSSRLFLLVILLLSAAALASADVVFTDTTFTVADYAVYAFTSSPTITVETPIQCGGCGTIGNRMSFTVDFAALPPGPPGSRSDWTALINTTFAYDPQTQGAIAALSVSGLKELSTDIPVTSGEAFSVRILQDGKLYGYAIPSGVQWSGTSSGWIQFFRDGLTAANFRQYDLTTGLVVPGSNPDFAGSEMFFGIGQWTSWAYPNELRVTNTWDNVTFDITPVPEPGSLLLLGSGLLGLGRLLKQRI